jgi:integrase
LPARALTVAAVERIKPPKSGQIDYFDKGFPGLVLRCSYGGAKTWALVYRLHGKLHRMTLGRWPALDLADARSAWRGARNLVAKGESPANRRPASADSFAAVAAEWMKRDQAGNRSAKAVWRMIEHDVLPEWRDRQISTINRRDVIDLIDRVTDRGSVVTARRLHAHVHRLFRWAVGRGVLDINPMAELPKPGAEVGRERVLSDGELRVVWQAAETIGWPFGSVIKLLILTGARRAEIGALRWSEVEGDKITLDAVRTKNSQIQHIPLSAPAAEVIAALPRIGDGFAFTTTGRTAVSGWSKAKTQIDKAAIAHNDGTPLADWHVHDLRRTVATGLQRLGFNLQIIETILGQVGGSRSGIIRIYQRHSFDAEKKIALDAWAREVERIVAGTAAVVVPMMRRGD